MPRPEVYSSVTESVSIDQDRLSALQNNKVVLGEEIARRLMKTEVNELSSFSTSFGQFLTIGTIFGSLRLFPPVCTMARTKDGTVFASSLEELDKQISLPACHTLRQWYTQPIDDNDEAQTLTDRGGLAPRALIKRIRFNATGISGHLGSVGYEISSVWAPNLNGEVEIEVQWTSTPGQTFRGKHLPEYLDILFRCDYSRMMWNVEECTLTLPDIGPSMDADNNPPIEQLPVAGPAAKEVTSPLRLTTCGLLSFTPHSKRDRHNTSYVIFSCF